MKNPVFVLVLAAGVLGAGQVMAQAACPGGTTRVNNLTGLIGGKTLCAARGNDRWQEFHSGNNSGPLIEYKRGPGHPMDPTETVGTWSATNGANSSLLTHTYTSAGAFVWLVCRGGATQAPGTYTLVSTTTHGTIGGATIQNGQVACP